MGGVLRFAAYGVFYCALLTGGKVACAGELPFIVLQSTTSTQNSGLLDYLLPLYRAHAGVEVRVVAVGTGQALNNARNGDGDVVLVHDRRAEEAFVAAGFGLERFDLMYNDFVIVGPASDPAGIRRVADPRRALVQIANSGALFVSRGDDSGTHRKERELWTGSGIDVAAASGGWYRETGSGMGATLNIAVGTGAYTLTDRASWISFKNKTGFTVLLEGDPALFNQYGIMVVNPARHPRVKLAAAQDFVDWLRGDAGQRAIAGFRVHGEQLFYPNAAR